MKNESKPSTNNVPRKKRAAKRLRVIASVPFRGSVSVKDLDAVIASVMAKRTPEVEAAVHLRDRDSEQLVSAAER